MSVKGAGARRKGSRAEIKVRNMLRTIYPTELHKNVQRVPLSGAAAIKGDVMDNNDPDSVYEVKCQETLCLNDWWRQAKAQAIPARTPILVVTQAYRPFYFILHKKDWDGMRDATEFAAFDDEKELKSTRKFMDTVAELEAHQVAKVSLDGDDCVVVPQMFYLEVKESIFLFVDIDDSK